MEDYIKPLTIKIKENTWKEFKYFVRRDTLLNDKIVELIEGYIKSCSNNSIAPEQSKESTTHLDISSPKDKISGGSLK